MPCLVRTYTQFNKGEGIFLAKGILIWLSFEGVFDENIIRNKKEAAHTYLIKEIFKPYAPFGIGFRKLYRQLQ